MIDTEAPDQSLNNFNSLNANDPLGKLSLLPSLCPHKMNVPLTISLLKQKIIFLENLYPNLISSMDQNSDPYVLTPCSYIICQKESL